MLVSRLRYAGGAALAVIAGAALLAPAAGAAPLHGFHFQALSNGADGEIESVCGATFLRERVAVTARHCVLEVSGPVRLACASGTVSGAARIERVIAHPTHDLALFRIDGVRGCAPSLDPPALEAAHGGPYRVWTMAPPDPSRSRPAEWTISELAVDGVEPDGPVIRLRLDRDCPLRGDSGAGLFSLHPTGRALHGLLIGGSPECPGSSVFVRLAPLRAWIEHHVAILAEDAE